MIQINAQRHCVLRGDTERNVFGRTRQQCRIVRKQTYLILKDATNVYANENENDLIFRGSWEFKLKKNLGSLVRFI
jgi:hypothetical protein